MNIHRDDVVQLIAGDEAGKRGKILRLDNKKQRVVVEGLNYVWKHLKPSQKNPRGGRLRKEAAVSLHRVMLVCPYCDKPARVRSGKNKEGRKARICVRCSKEI